MTDLLRAEPVAEARAGSNAQPISVGDLSLALKRHVEQGFSHVRVRGEISGFKRAGSGHAYLCLKDEQAVIDGVIWRTARGAVGFIPQDGVEVIATGRLTTYPGRSRYQIVIESLELAGEGAMLALLEKRKAMLAAEGLFAAERKRPLPFIPQRIGVVTSPTGAVIRDILHRLADRFPSHVVLWPVPVQGQGSAELIAGAVTGFAQMPQHERPDLLIVARGGGSIEDLWAFNEEVVLRAIAACSIPVISAVGHETDTTLCDYVADRRAPTPTAAAEMAVPVRHELLARVAQLGVRKGRCADRVRERGGERLDALARRLPRPDSLFAPQAQRVDDLAERSRRRLRARVEHASRDLLRLSGALRPGLLTQQLRGARQALEQLGRLAASLNPDNVLARGYARVTDRSGATLTSAAAAKAAGHLRLKFRDDELAVQVGTARVEPRPRRSYEPPEQTSFF